MWRSQNIDRILWGRFNRPPGRLWGQSAVSWCKLLCYNALWA